ncbi:MAG: RidA family protein [Flavobacteriia bacterium]|nr:RidA family protein [Flavobacteriia bacterium]
MKKALHNPKAPAPIGPYSPAILVGNQLFISGQIPVNPTSGELESSSIESATEQVMKNLEALLHAAHFAWSDVVKCSIFLKDFNDFQRMNAVYGSYFTENPPARETVQVSRLPMDAIIEISCIALKS